MSMSKKDKWLLLAIACQVVGIAGGGEYSHVLGALCAYEFFKAQLEES